MSTTIRLRALGNKLYKTFEQGMYIFHEGVIKNFYDNAFYKRFSMDRQSFVGNLQCGSSCFIMKYLLEKEGFDVKVIKNSRRDEYGIDDHVFLYLENHIFDPTYRQFMIDDRDKNNLCLYKFHLFCKISPFLINYPKKINIQLENLLKINAATYGTAFTNVDELSQYWEFQTDVTHRYNLHEYVNNKDLLDTKPDYYKELVDFLNNKSFIP